LLFGASTFSGVDLLSNLPVYYPIVDFACQELVVQRSAANIGFTDLLDLEALHHRPHLVFLTQNLLLKILNLVSECTSTCVFSCTSAKGENKDHILDSLNKIVEAEEQKGQLVDQFSAEAHASTESFQFGFFAGPCRPLTTARPLILLLDQTLHANSMDLLLRPDQTLMT